MSARTADARFAERQVATAALYAAASFDFLPDDFDADHIGSDRLRHVFLAAATAPRHPLEDRVSHVAREARWDESELWALLDAEDRLVHLDAGRFARRVTECARARQLAELLTWALENLRHEATVEPVVSQLRRIVASEPLPDGNQEMAA